MPVNSDNSIPKVDLLDRRPFANQIGEGIVKNFSNDHDCIVFGLNGIWGSGKSTLMNFIKEAIEKNCKRDKVKYKIYEFNPWMFSGQENLQKEFLEGLLEELKDVAQKAKEGREWIEKSLEYLKILKIIPQVGKDAYEIIQDWVKDADFMSSARLMKDRVDKILTKSKTRLFIFIDDIDRLTPDETAEILQLVKLNTNFKNTFFIVAYDREVVENSLRFRFGENSKRYLEKIVQVDYKVPEILPEKRMEIFFKELDNFMGEKSIEFDRDFVDFLWKYRGFSEYFRSLRDIYRYLNALYFRLPAIWKDVDVIDFLLLEAIRIFDYEGYENLYNFENRRRVSGTEVAGNKDLHLESFASTTEKIIKVLFEVERIHRYRRDEDKGFRDPRRRDRYFGLQISSFDVSIEEFEQFIVSDKKQIILKQIADAGRLGNFWTHISTLNKFKGKFFIDYHSLFNEIIIFLEDTKYQYHLSSAFQVISDAIKFSGSYFETLKIFFEEITKDRGKLSFPCFQFIYWILEDYEKYKSREDEDYQKFMKSNVFELEKVRKKYLAEWYSYIVSPSAWYYPYYVARLFMKYYAENNIDSYTKDVNRLLEDEKSLLGITQEVVYGYDDSGSPTRLNEYYDLILPKPLNVTFLKRLKEIFPTLSKNSDEYKRVKFILEKIA